MTPTSKISLFIFALEESLRDGSFVKLSLGGYKGAEAQLKNILVRKIQIKREEKLSFTYRYKTRDIVKNHDFAAGIAHIRESLTGGFQAATLFTTAFDFTLEKQSLKKKAPSHTAPAPSGHDRDKKRLIGTENKAYLHALNITDDQGVVFKEREERAA